MIQVLFFLFLFVSCKGETLHVDESKMISYQIESNSSDTLLVEIQSKIYNAFVQGIMLKENKKIVQISDELSQLYEKENQRLIIYWRSYLQFYSSILYLKMGDEDSAEDAVDMGIEWLEDLEDKNSEDYALLAMLQGFGIQFKNIIKVIFLSSEIKENGKKAISLDSTNLRAYYVFASNDFHTPEKYGGGEKAEEYLLKAISLPSQKIVNSYLPSWGKEEAFEMLIKLYIKKENWDLAKQYFQEGVKEYPESYVINQLASKLVGK
ncbi:MAG: hypothetical protein L3J41_07000 [Melioribacteraceae bacterium]|nr:hypothetical protein [Melioribacteraceae bacterium]